MTGLLRIAERHDDALGASVVHRRLLERAACGVARSNSLESISVEKMSIGTDTSTGPGPAAFGELKRLVDDLREQIGPLDAPGALDERPVDLELRRVGVEVDLLVRMLAVEVGRDVAGDDDHRDRIERRVGDAGRGVGQARAEMAEHHRRGLSDARIAVGGMRGDLLVARVDEADRAVRQRVSTAILVWPHSPKMCSTPRSSRKRTNWWETRSFMSLLHQSASRLAVRRPGVGEGIVLGHRPLDPAALLHSAPRHARGSRPSATG